MVFHTSLFVHVHEPSNRPTTTPRPSTPSEPNSRPKTRARPSTGAGPDFDQRIQGKGTRIPVRNGCPHVSLDERAHYEANDPGKDRARCDDFPVARGGRAASAENVAHDGCPDIRLVAAECPLRPPGHAGQRDDQSRAYTGAQADPCGPFVPGADVELLDVSARDLPMPSLRQQQSETALVRFGNGTGRCARGCCHPHTVAFALRKDGTSEGKEEWHGSQHCGSGSACESHRGLLSRQGDVVVCPPRRPRVPGDVWTPARWAASPFHDTPASRRHYRRSPTGTGLWKRDRTAPPPLTTPPPAPPPPPRRGEAPRPRSQHPAPPSPPT